MLQLELSEKHRKVLAETIDSSLSQLRDEIAHTDTHDYRELLIKRREALTAIRSKLQ